MSCQDRWRDEVEQLAAATGVAAGSVDGAQRCKNPDCRRPLRKDGTCPRGCPQAGSEPARPPSPPEVDALVCATEHLANLREWTGWTQIIAERALRDISDIRFQQGQGEGDPARGEEALLQLMATFDSLRNHAFTSDFERQALIPRWEQDPRIHAGRCAAIDTLLARAEAALETQPPDLEAAWRHLVSAQGWVLVDPAAYSDQGTRAQALLRQVLPVGEYQAGQVLRNYLAQRTGLPFSVNIDLPTGFRINPYRKSAGPQPHEFGESALQALRNLGLQPEEQECFVPLAQASAWLHEQVQTAQDTWQSFDTAWEAFDQGVLLHRAAAGPSAEEEPAKLADQARRYALPLWSSAWAVDTVRPTLSALTEEDPAYRRADSRTQSARTYAMAAVKKVPPPLLPQVLADFGWEKRVMGLLRFAAVREALLDGYWEMDVLENLPAIAERAVAGLQVCEQVEEMATQHLSGCSPGDPPGRVTWATLDDLLASTKSLEAALSPTDTGGDPQVFGKAVTAVVDALSQHLPPHRAPRKFGRNGERYDGTSRLQQSQKTLDQLWQYVIGGSTDQVPTSLLREKAALTGMPYGQYANRTEIVQWFAAIGNTPRRDGLARKVIFTLKRQPPRKTLRAADRTGKERTYKEGELVALDVDDTSQQGTVVSCLFSDLPNAPPETPIAPFVQVRLDDGSLVLKPIAQVEYVSKRDT